MAPVVCYTNEDSKTLFQQGIDLSQEGFKNQGNLWVPKEKISAETSDKINTALARVEDRAWKFNPDIVLNKYKTVTEALPELKSPLIVDMYAFTQSAVLFQTFETAQKRFFERRHEQQTTFTAFYRKPTYNLNFAVAGGIDEIISFLKDYHFSKDDLNYLASVKNKNGTPKFSQEFLEYLRDMNFCCVVDAVREGTFITPQSPIMRSRGPLLQNLLIEACILNHINTFSSTMTAAAIMRRNAGDNMALAEQAIRRGFGLASHLATALACQKVGFNSTSSCYADRLFGFPATGTVAHAFIMSFANDGGEERAMKTFMQYDSPFALLDTYNVKEGAKKAIKVYQELVAEGKLAQGTTAFIRIDSGDLAELSKKVKAMFDAEGIPLKVVLSNSITAQTIAELREQGAIMDGTGIGEALALPQAIAPVFKLSEGESAGDGELHQHCKLSNDAAKATIPGFINTRRYWLKNGRFIDVVYDENRDNLDLDNLYYYSSDKVLADGCIEKSEIAHQESLLQPLMKVINGVSQPVRELSNPSDTAKYVKYQMDNIAPYGKDGYITWGMTEERHQKQIDELISEQGRHMPSYPQKTTEEE